MTPKKEPNPRPQGNPEDRLPGAGAALVRLLGALLVGKYDEDKVARKRVGIATLAATMLGIIAVQARDASKRTDTLIENSRADYQQAIVAIKEAATATSVLAAEIRANTEASKAMQSDLISKIPPAAPQPRIPQFYRAEPMRPVAAKRKQANDEIDIGGVRP